MNFFGESHFAVPYWGKLYKRDVIQNSGFTPPDNYIAEDFVFNMHVFPFVKSLMFVDYVGYFWRWGGISSRKNDIWTSEKMLKRSNEIYYDSLTAIAKYNYEKALLPLMKLQVSNFRGNISQIAKYDASDAKAASVMKLIADNLNYDYYKSFDVIDDPLALAMAKKDVDAVYSICHDIYKKCRFKRGIRNTVSLIFDILSR